MTALDNKLLGIKQCAELIVKDTNLAISSLEEERKHKGTSRVRMVYWLDEVGILDKSTIKVFFEWADAYEYYRGLAKDIVVGYNKNNERLKCPITISDFTETTYYNNRDYPEFGIDNKRDGGCHTYFEYEETYLEELFIS